jgi:multidrug efflux pump subunit AcrB
LLSNLVGVEPTVQAAVASRYNLAPATDIYVSVQGRDMGSVAAEIQTLVDQMRPELPRGTQVAVMGQAQTMKSSFIQLGVGLGLAIVLVYLLIVVNFQSWVDAFIIITALPAALAGICWMLMLTGTTLSVPAMTGAIMTMGVATANSILIVAFARQRMGEGLEPLDAARDAGATRIRPVLMTALAMMIGMIPMALGLGEGAEQNAPLGRAVIGGLMFATVSTLLFVPVIFWRVRTDRKPASRRPAAARPQPRPLPRRHGDGCRAFGSAGAAVEARQGRRRGGGRAAAGGRHRRLGESFVSGARAGDLHRAACNAIRDHDSAEGRR